MKTGKEIKINKHKNYTISFGSVNNKESKAVYINISAWATPKLDDKLSYSRDIKDTHKKIKQILFNKFDSELICDFDKDRTIVDLDIRESGIRYGKRSFTNCEITLYLKNDLSVVEDSSKEKINNIIDLLIKNVLETNKTFNFQKKKK